MLKENTRTLLFLISSVAFAIAVWFLSALLNDLIAFTVMEALKVNPEDYLIEGRMLMAILIFLLAKKRFTLTMRQIKLLPLLKGSVWALIITTATVAVFSLRFKIQPGNLHPSIITLTAAIFTMALAEEFIFRGLILEPFIIKKKAFLGLLISSMFWSLAHLLNSDFSITAYINTFLFGIIIGGLYIEAGDLTSVTIFHFLWNTLIFVVFGFNLSGFEGYSSLLKIDSATKGVSEFVWGGGYGPEGSIIVTVILLAAAVIISGKHFAREYLGK